jgi:peptide/nickel transport system permease protein
VSALAPLPRFLVTRLAQGMGTLLVVTAAVFALLQAIPGGPLQALVGEAAGVDPEAVRRAEQLFGYDRPLLERYAVWLLGVLRGDLGTSWSVAVGRPVLPLLLEALGNTLLLTVTALAIAVAVGLLTGALAALRPGSSVDLGLALGTLLLGGAPAFWLGLILIVVFAVELAWLPAGGASTIGRGDLADRLRYLVLPVLTLAAGQCAVWGRYTRATLLDVLGREYVRVAVAKGLPTRAVVLRHALPNALPVLVGLLAVHVPALIAGATVTEAVFSYPGLGRLLVTALRAHDWPLVQGVALLLGVGVVLASVTSEVAVGLLDPRVRG